MTSCNNNDQTWFSDALTSAEPLWGSLKPLPFRLGFQLTLGVQQMLMHRKTCLIPIVLERDCNIFLYLLSFIPYWFHQKAKLIYSKIYSLSVLSLSVHMSQKCGKYIVNVCHINIVCTISQKLLAGFRQNLVETFKTTV